MSVRPELLEVATGGDPAGAVVRALESAGWMAPGTVVHVAVEHDRGCPCERDVPTFYCTCEVVRLRPWRAA